jgi:hypothetical protein
MYFTQRNYSGFCDKFELHMSPIITTQSTIQFDKRDSTLSQAQQFIQLVNDAGVVGDEVKKQGLSEILTEAFPKMGSSATGWVMTNSNGEGADTTGMAGGPDEF